MAWQPDRLLPHQLHDAFNKTEWAVDQFRFQRALIERTIGLGGR